MIDRSRIEGILKEFSVPRLSGSDAEEESFNLLKEKVRMLNLKHTTQNFSFSSFYSRVYPKISLSLLFSILFIFIFQIEGVYTLSFMLIVLILFFFIIIYTRNPERIKLGRIFYSKNVFVKLACEKSISNSITPSNIFLFSHIDSKGQRFTIKARVISVWVWIISILVGFTLNVIEMIFTKNFNFILRIIEVIILTINFTSTLILVLNTTNNNSKGAIDNASGVACVFELLNYFQIQENRLKNYNLWFVFTGAEECGTMGIRNFYQNIKDLDRNTNYTLNFDSICSKIYLYNHGFITDSNSKTLALISEKKDVMELKKSKIFYPGIRSDGLYLLRKHFTGLGMGDETVYKYIHSTEDTIDKINVSVLEELCNLIIVLLNEIDNKLL